MVPRGVASDDEHMDESTSKLVQTEEEIFAGEISDEELEAAASRTTEEITLPSLIILCTADFADRRALTNIGMLRCASNSAVQVAQICK